MSEQALIDRAIGEIKRTYAKWGKSTTVAEMRGDWDELFRGRARPEVIERFDAGGVPAAWVGSSKVGSDLVVLYLHGGGFRLGSMVSHLGLMQRIAEAADARVLAVDYRLSPEHRFPLPLEDAMAAYRWLIKCGIAPDKIVLAGDSAGGGLVVASLMVMRDEGLPLPRSGLVMSAWTDMEASGQSYDLRAASDPFHSRAMILAMAKSYLNGADPRDIRASPLFGDFRGLPPLLIQCGDCETGLDDSVRLHEQAKSAGVATELQVYPAMFHVFQMFPELRASVEALTAIGAFVRDRQ